MRRVNQLLLLLGKTIALQAHARSPLLPARCCSFAPAWPACALSDRLCLQPRQLSPAERCHTISLWLLALLAVAIPLLMAQHQQRAHEARQQHAAPGAAPGPAAQQGGQGQQGGEEGQHAPGQADACCVAPAAALQEAYLVR